MYSPELQSAYILHTRLYRDTSLLIEFFTEREGRLSAVAKGARSPRSPWRGILLPGVPLLINCKGKHDLLTLVQAEPNGNLNLLQGTALISQFYLNELLLHLLQRQDAHPDVFVLYHHTLHALAAATRVDIPLRIFEIELLRMMGYGLSLDKDALTQQPVKADKYYQLDIHLGVMEIAENKRMLDKQLFYQGKTLLALSRQTFDDDPSILQEAKRIMRKLLDHLLNGRAIKTRELFI